MIKAVIFDYDGTLSNRKRCIYNKYRDNIKVIFPDLDPNSVYFETIVQDCIIWDEFGTHSKKRVYEQLNKKYNANIDVEYWVQEWLLNYPKYQMLMDDCIDTLNVLKTKFKIGLLTNGVAETQKNKLKNVGILPYLDAVCVTGDLGVQKPDPYPFEVVLNMLDVKPEEAVFVGDIYSTDILGASNAHIQPIWLSTDHLTTTIDSVIRIEKLSDLIKILM